MISPRAKSMILGALVADTAAMGTHWIYDQDHIRKIAPEYPEFLVPSADNYKGVPAYFAHSTRTRGMTSQYGEQLIVMLDALAANNGTYDASLFAKQFRKHFGYGGAWVGYIDHATRETLNNFQRVEDEAIAAAQTLPFEGDTKITKALVGKVLELRPRYANETLRQKYEDAVRQTHDDATVAYAQQVLDTIIALQSRYGAIDEQMPATAKLPALIATLEQADDRDFLTCVDSAVRTTSDHPNAHDLGRVCARMMQAALKTDDLGTIIAAGHDAGSPEAQTLITQARGMTEQDSKAVTKHFGMACDLTYGVPSVVHNILTARSFTEAVRRNIYAGGDTCGRAIILGSILGAVYGVGTERGIPQNWVDQVRIEPVIMEKLTSPEAPLF